MNQYANSGAGRLSVCHTTFRPTANFRLCTKSRRAKVRQGKNRRGSG
ncbi:hypothetical protein GIV65_24500, partial [Pseudomonas syringae]|nr:hypothetical protein [Pseudomonas syringae]